jgi:uncharacterized protein YgiB involved in biofilm formation
MDDGNVSNPAKATPVTRTRKSSARISLVLISAAAVATLAGCESRETRRDVYASKQDCLADWGNDPKDCEPAYDHPGSRGASTYYYGRPYTYQGGHIGARSSKAVGSTSSVSRGGFGSSARSSGG